MTDGITKSPTGIDGFDDLTLGGLPTGRPSLVCGSAGCGKTLFASTFLFNGAKIYDEPGVFVTFEERPVDIIANVDSTPSTRPHSAGCSPRRCGSGNPLKFTFASATASAASFSPALRSISAS